MDSLSQLVETFASDPQSAIRLMRDLLRADGEALVASALPILRDAPDLPGIDALIDLLSRRGLTVSLLADPAQLTDEEAVAVARRVIRADPRFDLQLLEFAALADRTRLTRSATMRRILHIVADISDRRRAAASLMTLLRRADNHVRSHAALLLGSATSNCAWASRQLRDQDPRVRANVVESLWGTTSGEAIELFRAAAADSHNRVAGNALLGLYHCGLAESIRGMAVMAGSDLPAFRATAAWVMGTTGDPRFISTLTGMHADTSPGVPRNVLRGLSVLRRLKPPPEKLCIVAAPQEPATFMVHVLDSESRPVEQLPATAFACWSGDVLIVDYDVTPFRNGGRYLLRASVDPASGLVEVRTRGASGSSSLLQAGGPVLASIS